MPEKIAFFGGTFDPVHFGHLITGRAVAEALGVDRMHLVPTSCPPHKSPPLAGAHHRLEMLRLAVRDEPLFALCELEIFRAGPSYTCQTLAALRRQHGRQAELYWVVGADMLATLDTWHRVDEVLELAKIVVAARPPWGSPAEQTFAKLGKRFSARQIDLLKKLTVETPLVDISSTDIRRRIAAGASIRYLTPDVVMYYIIERGLYR